MPQLATVSLIASLVLLTLAVLPLSALAWNIPGHILSGIIADHVLQQENPQTIEKVRAVLEKHLWYANQWQSPGLAGWLTYYILMMFPDSSGRNGRSSA